MMKKILLFAVLLTLSLCGLLIGIDYKHVRDAAAEAEDLRHSKYDRFTETFLVEQRALAGWDFLPDQRCARDAGAVLNPMIEWDGDVSQTEWAQRNRGVEPIKLPLERASIRDAKDQGWANLMAVIPTEGVDFSWWDGMPQSYDCWDIDTNSPRMELILETEATDTPIPLVVEIVDWNALRLVEGRRTGDDRSALEALRGWVRLLMSSENLVNVMIGVALLKHEADHLQYLDGIGVTVPDWQGMDHETVSMLRRVALASTAYSGLYTPDDYVQVSADLFPCVALSEGLTLGSLIQTEGRDLFPAQMEKLTAGLEAKGQCRLKALRAKWAQEHDLPVTRASEFVCSVAPTLSCFLSRTTGRAPSWTRPMLVELAMSSMSDFPFSGYQRGLSR